MKEDFSSFDLDNATPIALPLDFAMLCSLLAHAQSQSPTARIAADPEIPPAAGRPPAENAVVVFRNEPGRAQASAAMGGSFHAGAAGHVTE